MLLRMPQPEDSRKEEQAEEDAVPERRPVRDVIQRHPIRQKDTQEVRLDGEARRRI